MYAISTVGSLVGTFVASLLLIPLVGTQRTFLIFALITAARGRARAAAALRCSCPLALAAAARRSRSAPSRTPTTGVVIYETDTEYQYARVVELPDGERQLELNEGQAVHSLYRPDTVLTGNYWDGYLVEPFSVRDEPPRPDRDPRQRRRHDGRAPTRSYFPDTRIDARRDRRRAVRDRHAATSACATRPQLRALHRGRAAVPAPDRRALRRDLRRRLPPALHPVLPDHDGVLRARARAAAPRRRR